MHQLLVEHHEADHDSGWDRYVTRYFVSYPFCGVKWFKKPPSEIDQQIPRETKELNNDNEGWLYGGDVSIVQIDTLPEITPGYDFDGDGINDTVYPFVVTVQGSLGKPQAITLAALSSSVRSFWIEEMGVSTATQRYLSACVECEATPSSPIFNATMHESNEIIVENIILSNANLGSLILYCRLTEALGTSFKTMHFDNARLQDKHMPLLSSLLKFTNTLSELNCVENHITDKGMTYLSDAIKSRPSLTSINLASNFIGDEGGFLLALALKELPDLQTLDLSRNNLTSNCMNAFNKALGKHNSKLKSIKLCYNDVGNSAAMLVTLLMTIHRPVIEYVDISYCGIQPEGMEALSVALIDCPSITELSILGNCLGNRSISLILDCMTQHWNKFAFGDSGVADTDLLTGGVSVANDGSLEALTVEATRTVLTSIEKDHLLYDCTLRRRGPTPHVFGKLYPQSAFIPSSSSSSRRSDTKSDHDVAFPHHKHMDLVCMRVQLPHYVTDGRHLLDLIAEIVDADPRQFRILSQSSVDDANTTFIIFTPSFPTQDMIRARMNRKHRLSTQRLRYNINFNAVMSHISVSRIMTKTQNRLLERVVGGLTADEIDLAMHDLPSPSAMLQSIQELAAISSPLLGHLGIRTVFTQAAHEPLVPTNPVDVYGNQTSQPDTLKPGGKFHERLKQSHTNTDKLYYMPPLLPVKDGYHENMGTFKADPLDIDADNDDADNNIDLNEFITHDGVLKDVRAVIKKRSQTLLPEEADKVKGVTPVVGGTSTLDWHHAISNGDGLDESEMVIAKRTSQIFARAAQDLVRSKALDPNVGKFWQAVFGIPDHHHVLVDLVNGTLDTMSDRSKLFRSVRIRRELMLAVMNRDMSEMEIILEAIDSRRMGVIEGPIVNLAKKLVARMKTLLRDYDMLDELVKDHGDIEIIDEFLLQAGEIAYEGPEVLDAIAKRENLLKLKLSSLKSKRENQKFRQYLKIAKRRALLTNLMIRRDMNGLLELLGDDSLIVEDGGGMNEEFAAKKLLHHSIPIENQLQTALNLGTLEAIENSLADAAYHYGSYRTNKFEEAETMLQSNGGDIGGMIVKLARSMMRLDHTSVRSSMHELRRVGWVDMFLSPHAVESLMKQADLLQKEEFVTDDLMDIARAIKNRETISYTIDDLRQIYMDSHALNLHRNPNTKIYVDVIFERIRFLRANDNKQSTGILNKIMGTNRNRPSNRRQSFISGMRTQEVAENLGLSVSDGELFNLVECQDAEGVKDFLVDHDAAPILLSVSSSSEYWEWLGHLQAHSNHSSSSWRGENQGQHDFISGYLSMTKAEPDNDGQDDNEDDEDDNNSENSSSNINNKLKKQYSNLSWRRRYFTLSQGVLHFYANMGSDPIGQITISGSNIRHIDPSLVGRPNVIQVREAVDVSKLDFRLVEAARSLIYDLERKHSIQELKDCISRYNNDNNNTLVNPGPLSTDGDYIEAVYLVAASYGEFPESELKFNADRLVCDHRRAHLETGIRSCLVNFRRFLIEEHLDQWTRLGLDKDELVYRACLSVRTLPEPALTTLRARKLLSTDYFTLKNFSSGDLRMRDLLSIQRGFAETLSNIMKSQSWSRLQPKFRKIALATAVHKAGSSFRLLVMRGVPCRIARRVIDHLLAVLASVGDVSTESIGLAYSVYMFGRGNMAVEDHHDELKVSNTNSLRSNKIAQEMVRIGYSALESCTSMCNDYASHQHAPHYRLHDYDYISSNYDNQKKNKVSSSTEAISSISFQSKRISAPILTPSEKKGKKYNNDALGAFELLQCYQGEREQKSLSRNAIATFNKYHEDGGSNDGSVTNTKTLKSRASSVTSMSFSLIASTVNNMSSKSKIGSEEIPAVLLKIAYSDEDLGEELIVQCCKQIMNNPKAHSRQRGMKLLLLYLHTIIPSVTILPRLRNFTQELHEFEQDCLDILLESIQNNNDYDVSTIAHASIVKNNGNNTHRKMSEKEKKALEIELNRKKAGDKLRERCRILANNVVQNLQWLDYISSVLARLEASINANTIDITQHDMLLRAPSAAMVASVVSNVQVSVEIVLMTGSVYRLKCRVADLRSPQNMLSLLYSVMLGSADSPRHFKAYHALNGSRNREKNQITDAGFLPTFDVNQYDKLTGRQRRFALLSEAERAELLSYVFRGFYFTTCPSTAVCKMKEYATDVSRRLYSTLGRPTISEHLINIKNIPIQPPCDSYIEWDDDLAWRVLRSEIEDRLALMNRRNEEASRRLRDDNSDDDSDDEHNWEDEAKKVLLKDSKQKAIQGKAHSRGSLAPLRSYTSSDVGDASMDGTSGRRFLLRSNTLPLSEQLVSEMDLLGGWVPHKDVKSMESLWLKWLQGGVRDINDDDSITSTLPRDAPRVDLLFAEECRYVNSSLYAATDDCTAYLLALQLVLSWRCDSRREDLSHLKLVSPYTWGAENAALTVAFGTDLAVRPCHRGLEGYPSVLRGVQMSNLKNSNTSESQYYNTNAMDTTMADNQHYTDIDTTANKNGDDHDGHISAVLAYHMRESARKSYIFNSNRSNVDIDKANNSYNKKNGDSKRGVFSFIGGKKNKKDDYRRHALMQMRKAIDTNNNIENNEDDATDGSVSDDDDTKAYYNNNTNASTNASKSQSSKVAFDFDEKKVRRMTMMTRTNSNSVATSINTGGELYRGLGFLNGNSSIGNSSSSTRRHGDDYGYELEYDAAWEDAHSRALVNRFAEGLVANITDDIGALHVVESSDDDTMGSGTDDDTFDHRNYDFDDLQDVMNRDNYKSQLQNNSDAYKAMNNSSTDNASIDDQSKAPSVSLDTLSIMSVRLNDDKSINNTYNNSMYKSNSPSRVPYSPEAFYKSKLSANATKEKDVDRLAKHAELLALTEGDNLLDPVNMTATQHDALFDLLEILGVQVPGNDAEEKEQFLFDVIRYIRACQLTASSLNIRTTQPHYRYMLKRGYLSYLSSWPLAGSRFVEAILMEIKSNNVNMNNNEDNDNDNDNRSGDESSRGEHMLPKPRKTIVALNQNCIRLLDARDWKLMYEAGYHELEYLQGTDTTASQNTTNMNGEGDEEILGHLEFTVRGVKFKLSTHEGNGLCSHISRCSMDCIGCGSFEHGIEAGLDFLNEEETGIERHSSPWDAKLNFRKYLDTFPLLPPPPRPPSLERSSDHFFGLVPPPSYEVGDAGLDVDMEIDLNNDENEDDLFLDDESLPPLSDNSDDDDDENNFNNGNKSTKIAANQEHDDKSVSTSGVSANERALQLRINLTTAGIAGQSLLPSSSLAPPPNRRLITTIGNDDHPSYHHHSHNHKNQLSWLIDSTQTNKNNNAINGGHPTTIEEATAMAGKKDHGSSLLMPSLLSLQKISAISMDSDIHTTVGNKKSLHNATADDRRLATLGLNATNQVSLEQQKTQINNARRNSVFEPGKYKSTVRNDHVKSNDNANIITNNKKSTFDPSVYNLNTDDNIIEFEEYVEMLASTTPITKSDREFIIKSRHTAAMEEARLLIASLTSTDMVGRLDIAMMDLANSRNAMNKTESQLDIVKGKSKRRLLLQGQLADTTVNINAQNALNNMNNGINVSKNYGNDETSEFDGQTANTNSSPSTTIISTSPTATMLDMMNTKRSIQNRSNISRGAHSRSTGNNNYSNSNTNTNSKSTKSTSPSKNKKHVRKANMILGGTSNHRTPIYRSDKNNDDDHDNSSAGDETSTTMSVIYRYDKQEKDDASSMSKYGSPVSNSGGFGLGLSSPNSPSSSQYSHSHTSSPDRTYNGTGTIYTNTNTNTSISKYNEDDDYNTTNYSYNSKSNRSVTTATNTVTNSTFLHDVAMKHNHAAISQHNKSKYGPQFGTKGTKVIISKNTKGGTPTGLPKK